MPKKRIKHELPNFDPQPPLTTQVTPQMGEYNEYSRLNSDGEQVRSYTGMGIFNPALELEEGNFNLVGMNDGVLQAGISADDGTFLAGGGSVTLGDDGLTIFTDDQAEFFDKQKIIFRDVATNNELSNIFTYQGDGSAKEKSTIIKTIKGTSKACMTSISMADDTGTGSNSSRFEQRIFDDYTGLTESVTQITNTAMGSSSQLLNATITCYASVNDDMSGVFFGAEKGSDDNHVTIYPTVTTFGKSIQIIPESGSTTEGILSWNTDRDTLNLSQTGTSLQLGQEVHFYVINQTGADIPDGTVVQYDGALGASGIIKVKPAISDGSIPAIQIMGITTQDIANGAKGKVTFFGEVHGINTSGYTAGDILYLNPSVAGGLTATEPVAPNLRYAIAMAIDSKNNGTLMVRAIYSMALHELNDVTLTSPASGQLLTHNGTKWINSDPSVNVYGNINSQNIVQASHEFFTNGNAGQFEIDTVSSGGVNSKNGEARHLGIVTFRSSASANSGGRVGFLDTDPIIYESGITLVGEFIIRTLGGNAGHRAMLGFYDSAAAFSSMTPTNCNCFTMTGDGTNFTLKYLDRVAGSGSAVTILTTSNNTWYKLKIVVEPDLVKYYVYNSSGTEVGYAESTSTPTAAMSFGVKAFRTTTAASDIIDLDRMDFYGTSVALR
jgi:hypothetical protein